MIDDNAEIGRAVGNGSEQPFTALHAAAECGGKRLPMTVGAQELGRFDYGFENVVQIVNESLMREIRIE